jgi:hypothetical protein
MVSYKKFSHIFKEGQTLYNNNGYSYKVINVESQTKVLFERVTDGERVLGMNPGMYYKTNGNGVTSDVLEWGYGKYQ